MALNPGNRLGPYEILARIGAAGMGDVYRAKDLKLGRDVAIKVLREKLATDPERLRRFEQEARSSFALQLPEHYYYPRHRQAWGYTLHCDGVRG